MARKTDTFRSQSQPVSVRPERRSVLGRDGRGAGFSGYENRNVAPQDVPRASEADGEGMPQSPLIACPSSTELSALLREFDSDDDGRGDGTTTRRRRRLKRLGGE